MILKGNYNTAKVFTQNIEQKAIAQIEHLLNHEFISGSKIRIMPDVHAGAGCCIGTTMTITDTVVPNLVGVDIGCGMETVELTQRNINLHELDQTIHQKIPAGFAVRDVAHPFIAQIDLSLLRCANQVNLGRAEFSLGTLGGGNHFIELDRDEEGRLFLVVHSGSRYLGKQVAQYYQQAAACELNSQQEQKKALIQDLKSKGREKEIQQVLLKLSFAKVDKSLAYVHGKLFEDYLHDLAIVMRYAALNRKAMIQVILNAMNLDPKGSFTTIHNYIDIDTKPMILRKGAISAKKGERVLIPMNMRDGSLICTGKGNPDWNYSAPHGCGRMMSRMAAKRSFTLSEFEQSMQGVYSSTVNSSTLDEAPFAYKPMAEIMACIADAVDIESVIVPLYNFKAAN